MQKYEQVVSLAGVYDALVSDRVYKKAYSHEKAIQMILNGERGKKEQVAMHSEKPLELAGGGAEASANSWQVCPGACSKNHSGHLPGS